MIAQESARILIEEGIENVELAKQKAAKRLGYGLNHRLPGNEEIDLAVSEYHRLFRSRIQESHIRKLRTVALEAMTFLRRFSPRLVGKVVDGSAGRHSPVIIYLSSENPEPVLISFMDAGIPFVESSNRRIIGGRKLEYPVVEFVLDDIRIEAHILSETSFRESLQNRKTPVQSATLSTLRKLLERDPVEFTGQVGN